MNTKQKINIIIDIIDRCGGLINGLHNHVIGRFENNIDLERCFHVFCKSPLSGDVFKDGNEIYVKV